MEFHEIANIFPMVEGAELTVLSTDIKKNGLIDPIWLYEGKILDGRNRYRACQEAGIEPRFQPYPGDDPLQHVISLNLHRRHLNESQRGLIASRLAMIPKHLHKPDRQICLSQPEAAQMLNVSERTIKSVKAIERESPDLIYKLESGEMTVHEAQKVIRKKRQIDKEAASLATAPKDTTWTVTDDQVVVPCDVLIADPPYGILTETWEPGAGGIEDLTRLWATRWSECDANFIISFFSQRFMWEGKKWFDESLYGYKFQQLLIWHYPNNKSPQSRMGFKQTWEPIFFYRRNGCEKKIRVGGSEWGEGLNDFDCHVAAVPQSNFNEVNTKIHPAQKPLSVMRWLVNATSTPGELIVDPFAGSGTTGIAAVQLNRQFHGIETDAEMSVKAKERISCYGRV